MNHYPVSIVPLGAVIGFPRPQRLIRAPTPRISVGPGTDAKHWMTAKICKSQMLKHFWIIETDSCMQVLICCYEGDGHDERFMGDDLT